MTREADLLVVGGGTAGLAAARTAARLKKTVVMVQDGPVGGDCTFTGCVPSKTLLEATAAGLGFDAAMHRVHEAVDRIAATETADVLRDEGIDVVEGRARFTSPTTIRIGAEAISAKHVVVATGSSPARPGIKGLAGVDALDSDSVWRLRSRPTSLIVVGGGPVGCELAQAMARCGTSVTLLEQGPRLLAREDPSAAEVLHAALTGCGVDVCLGRRIEAVRQLEDEVAVELDDGTVLHAERLLLATGRTPGTADLGLDRAGVRMDEHGFVIVDDRMASTVKGVWAAGDVNGRLLYTHAADEMGRTAAMNALRPLRMRVHERSMPRVVFTDPEVAQVGLTEAQAAREGNAVVAELPMTAVDRAIAAGRTEGFAKLICRPRLGSRALGRLVGATIVAPRAGEMIHELALAVRTGMPVFRLAQTVHAYPSWSIAVRSAAAQFLFETDGRAARPARES